MAYQHFSDVADGKVNTLHDCIQVIDKVYGHIDKEQLGDDIGTAGYQFMVEVANEIGRIVVSTGKPYSAQLVQDIPAPPQVVERLAILEKCASDSYMRLCQQQENRFEGIAKCTPQFA